MVFQCNLYVTAPSLTTDKRLAWPTGSRTDAPAEAGLDEVHDPGLCIRRGAQRGLARGGQARGAGGAQDHLIRDTDTTPSRSSCGTENGPMKRTQMSQIQWNGATSQYDTDI